MKKIDWTTIFISVLAGIIGNELWQEIKKREVNVRAPASIKK